MEGRIYITSAGYDPDKGKFVNDPYLGPNPTLGACRPDIRKAVEPGDQIFFISGKVPDYNQFVIGGFEVDSKISACEAYNLYPEHRLETRADGQLIGNIIVDSKGQKHRLDRHPVKGFEDRIENYIVGKNEIVLSTPEEISRGRKETMEALQDILGKRGETPFDLIGRGAKKLSKGQVEQLREWLRSLKS